MSTPQDKLEAKAALVDLIELCKDKPMPKWHTPFRILMDFINGIATPANGQRIYKYIGGASPGDEYEMLAPARPAGELRDTLQVRNDSDLIVYRSLETGEVFVRLRADFDNRMLRME